MPYVGGLYTGIKYYAGLVNNIEQVSQLDAYIAEKVDKRKEDSIVSIFMMPYPFYTSGTSPIFRRQTFTKPTTIQGYTPRNKKLLTYPYNFLTVDTLNDSHDYRYEMFRTTDTFDFIFACGMSPNPEIVCYPMAYKGSINENSTETVTCSGFPQCAFSIDAYRAWLAQKSTGQFLSAAGSGIASIAGMAAATTPAGMAVAGVLGAIGIASSVNSMVKDSTQGSKSRGNIGTSTDVAMRYKGIFLKHMQISGEQARMIDDFFDRYGYSCCRIKIPNRNTRPYWNYVKTNHVDIHGAIPADHMDKLRSIYDNGITFWKHGSNVGNYSLNNSIA